MIQISMPILTVGSVFSAPAALNVRLDRADLKNAEDGTVVFVGNIPWSCTDADLRSLFEAYSPCDVHVKTTVVGLRLIHTLRVGGGGGGGLVF